MRSRGWLVALVAVFAATPFFPMQERVSAQAVSGIVISEYRFRGPLGANDEFIELFNASLAPINVSGWQVRSSNNVTPPGLFTRATLPANTIINPGCYYLLANANSGGYSGTVTPNQTYTVGFADDGGVALTTTSTSVIVDQVGQGTAPTAFGEGTRLPMQTTDVNRGNERRPGGAEGHEDTNNNVNDFREIVPGRPQNSSPASCLTPRSLSVTASASPAAVQHGDTLTVFGTVTTATLPASSSIQVLGDLSAVGGSATTPLLDDGVAPDLTANDRVFTASVSAVPYTAPLGARPVNLSVSDVQGRTATHSTNVNVVGPAVMYLPHDIQGPGAVSPLAPGAFVTVRGVVTARTADGFFLQTEAGMEDADAQTSEGLFVRAGGAPLASAVVGHFTQVTALVGEFTPPADSGSAPLTELNNVVAVHDVNPSAVPDAIVLTNLEVSDSGSLDQLERFEAMRVTVPSLVAVSGTDSNGSFFAVLNGQARPFREAGVENGAPVVPCAIGPCNVPVFDGNPERVRVDSDAIEGVTAVMLSTGAVMTGVTGPLDFAARHYTLLPEGPLAPSVGMTATGVPAASSEQFTVASLSLNGASSAAKASLMIRQALNTPDIIGVQQVADLLTLAGFAAQVDNDAQAAGDPLPQYEAFWSAGNGFLVRRGNGRVGVATTGQAGGGDLFNDSPLFEHAPLVLLATLNGPSNRLPQQVTVVTNQLQSLENVATDAAVRARRQAQADFIANYLQFRQSNNPSEAIVALGGFEAFNVNDGYVDVTGTVRGVPAPPDQVALASAAVVSPAFVNVSDVPGAYSEVVNGNAQAVDHLLASSNLSAQFAGVAYVHINVDFSAALSADATTPVRLSNRDPIVAYFVFPADVDAPVFSFLPQDQSAEAQSSAGAVVDYPVPSATDNLDASVSVTCTPAAGSLFAVGSTGVTCSTQDLAGNVATAAFSITVTAPPAETVFGHMTGMGHVYDGPQRTWFLFDVRESANFGERGFVVLQVREGFGRPDRYLSATVTDVRFSNSDGYAPGRYPRTGVDTVVFTGMGSWNGRGGYRYEITASDRGEPGPRRDTLSLRVIAPDGRVVESLGGTLHDGNIQSLR